MMKQTNKCTLYSGLGGSPGGILSAIHTVTNAYSVVVFNDTIRLHDAFKTIEYAESEQIKVS